MAAVVVVGVTQLPMQREWVARVVAVRESQIRGPKQLTELMDLAAAVVEAGIRTLQQVRVVVMEVTELSSSATKLIRAWLSRGSRSPRSPR